MTTKYTDVVPCSWMTVKRRVVSVSWIYYIVMIFILTHGSNSQIYKDCTNAQGQFTACFPPAETILPNTPSNVTLDPADATCGSGGTSETYIWLGDVSRFQTCPPGEHSREKMLDLNERREGNTNTWWQSRTWPVAQYDASNPQYPIVITFSIAKKYLMTKGITLTFRSARPKEMVIEKSADNGQTWTTLQYYSRDCARQYPNVPTTYATNLTAVICSEEYSEETNTQVFFDGASGRMKNYNLDVYFAEMDKPEMRSFLIFTDVRVRLLYPATDSRETSKQPSDFLKYYYAISHVDISGSCQCNLHAISCMSDLNGNSVCDCSHNTEGVDCERCLPLYNNRPWREGSFQPTTEGTANACEKCECYDHAASCTYNATYGQGVCDNCIHNTTGLKCDECVDTFYPNVSAPLNDTNVCIACNCETLGLLDINNHVCQKNRVQPNIGQCSCKALVTGRRCDRCVDGYYGLLLQDNPGTCQVCGCNRYGAVNQICNYTTGQCLCKTSTEGRICDKCKAGYFRFPSQLSSECQACGCDPGGSTTPSCTEDFGMCSCIPHVNPPKCRQVESYFYIPALDEFIKQPSGGTCVIDGDLWTKPSPFDGDKFATCPPAGASTIQFEPITGTNHLYQISWPYYVSVRYTLLDAVARTGGSVEIRVNDNSNVDVSGYAVDGQSPSTLCPHGFGTTYTIPVNFTTGRSTSAMASSHVTLDKRCSYSLTLTLPENANSTTPILIDSIVFLPVLANTETNTQFRTFSERNDKAVNYLFCVDRLASLTERTSAMTDPPCKELLWSVAAELYKEAKQCQCNPVGTIESTCQPQCSCNDFGGQCSCKVGVGGRRCDACLPGYYNFTSTGCTPCNCASGGSKNGACNVTTGQCKCRPNVAVLGQTDVQGNSNDKQCRACVAGFYGYGSDGGCVSCTCNPQGSNGTQCDSDGQCPCKPTISGKQCDQCSDTYYRFSPDGCQSCNCDPRGSTALTCNLTTGRCQCKINVIGDKCDTCKSGFFNVASYNPRGCQPCFCFIHGTDCSSADNFQMANITTTTTDSWPMVDGYREAPSAYLGHKTSSYGRVLSFDLILSGTGGNISQVALVVLEGDGSQLVYKHPLQTVGGRNPIQVRFFPENWFLSDTTSPTPQEMYRVLANVTRIGFQTVINNLQNRVNSVTMETAEAAVGAIATNRATYVENCTCNPSDSVAGFSCETCRTGYQRSDPTVDDLRYTTCKACNCNGRTPVPAECDEMTGICLNCRNGTMGDNCERCAPNVITDVSCDVCADGFWGLGANGCQACNCSTMGTVPGTNCDKTSGRCECVSHVTGRQCDTCEENYHSLTITGCIVCDQCYTLVKEEADKLRAQLTNLTEVIAALRANDDTARLGPFLQRLDNATISLNKLLEFLSTASRDEASVEALISQYNQTIHSLSAQLEELSVTDINATRQHLQQTEINLQDAKATRQDTVNNVKSIYNAIVPLDDIATTLSKLLTSLDAVETYLRSLSSDSSSQITQILATVAQIENTTEEARKLSFSNLEKSRRLFEKHQNVTLDIAKLENIDATLETLSSSALSEAKRIEVKSNDTYNAATRLESERNAIGGLTYDFVQTNNTIQSYRDLLNETKSLAEAGRADVESKKAIVDQAIVDTEKQRMNSTSIIQRCNALNDRLTTAKKRADDSQLLSEKVFRDARIMLDTMKNFSTKAQEVNTKANASLQSVNTVTIESEQVIEQAAALMTSLSKAQQDSAVALEKARQAKTFAQQHNTELAPVETAATNLTQNITSDLSDFQQKAAQPISINATVVNAQATCQQLQSDIVAANADIAQTDGDAERAKTNIQIMQTEAGRILGDLSNLPSLDAAKIATLIQDVAALPGLFNEQQLTTTITELKNHYDRQQAWLNGLKARKAKLQKQIADMQLAQQRISFSTP